jgi:hypothetical protein
MLFLHPKVLHGGLLYMARILLIPDDPLLDLSTKKYYYLHDFKIYNQRKGNIKSF